MQGVPSSLILRNQSWVREHANALARRLPSNIERADLIQAGLIAVAQAAVGFQWEGDRDSDEAKKAFVRYAQQRVHGAMIDELRQMDHLSRGRRRQVKALQVARERWRSTHAKEATAAELSTVCGLSVDEIFELDADALRSQEISSGEGEDDEHPAALHEAATPQDEVEARVDTGLLMRRLESFFATLPERDRQVIDAYLGVGLSPAQLAAKLELSTSRLSQLFRSVCERIGLHLSRGHRSTDHVRTADAANFDDLIARREAELAQAAAGGAWGERLEKVFARTPGLPEMPEYPTDRPIVIEPGTRWG
jgi:RNA polymerase sigma factor for flagellar operon FliA